MNLAVYMAFMPKWPREPSENYRRGKPGHDATVNYVLKAITEIIFRHFFHIISKMTVYALIKVYKVVSLISDAATWSLEDFKTVPCIFLADIPDCTPTS